MSKFTNFLQIYVQKVLLQIEIGAYAIIHMLNIECTNIFYVF